MSETATGNHEDAWIDDLASQGVSVTHGVEYLAPGWMIMWADRQRASKYAGGFAMSVARELQTSVICIGAEDSGLVGETHGRGTGNPLWGVELSAGAGSGRGMVSGLRSAGILVLDQERTLSGPSLLDIDRHGSFSHAGRRYGGPVTDRRARPRRTMNSPVALKAF